MADKKETYEPPKTSFDEVFEYIWYRLVTLWPVKWALATTAFAAVAATYWWGDWQTWSWEVFSTMSLFSALVAAAISISFMSNSESKVQSIIAIWRNKTPQGPWPEYPPQLNLVLNASHTICAIFGMVFALLLMYKIAFVAVPWAWRGLWNLWSAVPIESLKDLSTPQWVCIAGVALALLVALAWWRNREPRAKDETRPIRV